MIDLTEFFLEWGMFRTKVVEKIKIQILKHILCSLFFRKSWRLLISVETYRGAGQATYNTAHAH